MGAHTKLKLKSNQELRKHHIISKTILVVSKKNMDISLPSSTTKPCVELPMSEHWGRKIQSNPFITLTLALKYWNK